MSSVLPFYTRAGAGYSVVFTYKVEGSWYGGTFSTMKPHWEGQKIPVSYDANEPDRNKYILHDNWLRWGTIAGFSLLALSLWLTR